ncbi:unnamed protein product, partial [Staurois parvus]
MGMDSSGHGWSVHTAGTVQNTGGSVHTAGTVQNTGGWCTQWGQFRTLTVSSLQSLSGRRAPDRDDQWSAFQGQPAISRSSPGTQQWTASRDMQPRTVCRVPQQQLPGHSAADRLQGHADMDSVQGPSVAAPRALSSGQ